MVEIAPLHGIRFDPARSGPIGQLIAPPYDVANAQANGAEFSISAIENVDLGQPGNQHEHAARVYDRWLAMGVLKRDDSPVVYVHRHQFMADERPIVRTGLIARVRLRDWADRVVLPHEATVPGPKAERLARLRAVGANLSPLYFLYRDPDGAIRRHFDRQTATDLSGGQPDRVGGIHQLDSVSDPALLAELVNAFDDRRLFVADGHHRYEAALLYRDEQRRVHPGVDGPWEYVLALLAAAEDPGVVVRPTHRVLTGGAPLPAAETLVALRTWFDVRPRGTGPDGAHAAALFGIVLANGGDEWTAWARPGEPHRALLPRERRDAWRSLGVSAVEAAIEHLNGHTDIMGERDVLPVVDESDAAARVRDGSAHAAFLLPAPSIDQLIAVAEQGDVLPPKSSWFEPKAPAGLVINDHLRSAP